MGCFSPIMQYVQDQYYLGSAMLVAPVLEAGVLGRAVCRGLMVLYWSHDMLWGCYCAG